MACITDNDEGSRGFWCRCFEAPQGPNADLWRRLSVAIRMSDRHVGDLRVLKVPSHVEAAE
eukprot:3684022-Pyramimonas_sp.AAC.1